MRPRSVVHDNIATASCPVWRARYATPLTPRAVRNERVAQAMEVGELEREAWLQARLTPLDRLLTDEEANALEDYVLCEQILSGSARCADYAGDRVQTSRSDMQLINDHWLAKLACHSEVKLLLTIRGTNVLRLFCAQMDPDGPSDAEAAIMLGIQGVNKRDAWLDAVKVAAGELVNGT